MKNKIRSVVSFLLDNIMSEKDGAIDDFAVFSDGLEKLSSATGVKFVGVFVEEAKTKRDAQNPDTIEGWSNR